STRPCGPPVSRSSSGAIPSWRGSACWRGRAQPRPRLSSDQFLAVRDSPPWFSVKESSENRRLASSLKVYFRYILRPLATQLSGLVLPLLGCGAALAGHPSLAY